MRPFVLVGWVSLTSGKPVPSNRISRKKWYGSDDDIYDYFRLEDTEVVGFRDGEGTSACGECCTDRTDQ